MFAQFSPARLLVAAPRSFASLSPIFLCRWTRCQSSSSDFCRCLDFTGVSCPDVLRTTASVVADCSAERHRSTHNEASVSFSRCPSPGSLHRCIHDGLGDSCGRLLPVFRLFSPPHNRSVISRRHLLFISHPNGNCDSYSHSVPTVWLRLEDAVFGSLTPDSGFSSTREADPAALSRSGFSLDAGGTDCKQFFQERTRSWRSPSPWQGRIFEPIVGTCFVRHSFHECHGLQDILRQSVSSPGRLLRIGCGLQLPPALSAVRTQLFQFTLRKR
jgi:hypothetical protein